MKPFTAALRAKGWTAREVAERWGVSPRALALRASRPSQKDWDALAGLPDRTQGDTNNLKSALRAALEALEKEGQS